MIRSIAAGTFALAALVSGCAKKLPEVVPVEGTVTLNGKPLPQASVTFMPMLDSFGAESNSMAETDDEGHFVLTCMHDKQPGAVVGQHVVLVTEGQMPDKMRGVQDSSVLDRYLAKRGNRPIPANYGTFTRTDLQVEVKPGGGPLTIDLKR